MQDELNKLFEDVRQLIRPILEADLMNCDKAVEAWQEKLIESIRDRQGISKKLSSLDIPTVYGDQWDICSNPLVTDVDVLTISNGVRVLRVSTIPFYFTDPKTYRKHALGAFQIHVYVPTTGSGLLPTLRIYNLWFQICGFRGPSQHPHIWEDGDQCLGNVEADVADLLSTGRLKEVVLVMLEFLQAVNIVDQAGKYITIWPYLDPDDGSIVFPEDTEVTLPSLPGKPAKTPKEWLAGCKTEAYWYDWLAAGRRIDKSANKKQDEEDAHDDE